MEQHILLSRGYLFRERTCLFQQDNAKLHSACVTTAWLWSKSMQVLDWPACGPVSCWKCVAHYEAQNTSTEVPDCWATEVVYQARVGKNSAFKTTGINVLRSQKLTECCWRKRCCNKEVNMPLFQHLECVPGILLQKKLQINIFCF